MKPLFTQSLNSKMASFKYVFYVSGLTASVDFPNISAEIIILTSLLMHFWIN
jgi:hypothetical protein